MARKADQTLLCFSKSDAALQAYQADSRPRIEDLHFGNSTGTLTTVNATSFQCSMAAPCTGIELYNDNFTVFGEGLTKSDGHLCSGVLDPNFACSSGCGPDNEWCPSY